LDQRKNEIYWDDRSDSPVQKEKGIQHIHPDVRSFHLLVLLVILLIVLWNVVFVSILVVVILLVLFILRQGIYSLDRIVVLAVAVRLAIDLPLLR